jgi:hypothetical protein
MAFEADLRAIVDPTRRIGIAVTGNATKYDIDRVAALALTA